MEMPPACFRTTTPGPVPLLLGSAGKLFVIYNLCLQYCTTFTKTCLAMKIAVSGENDNGIIIKG